MAACYDNDASDVTAPRVYIGLKWLRKNRPCIGNRQREARSTFIYSTQQHKYIEVYSSNSIS